MSANPKSRSRRRVVQSDHKVVISVNGEAKLKRPTSSSATHPQGIVDALNSVEVPPALSQKLQDLFGLRFEQLQSFWGLYSVLSQDVGLQVSPDEVLHVLDGPLKELLERQTLVAVDGGTHVETIEVFRYLVFHLRHKNTSNTAVSLRDASAGQRAEEERRALITSALLEKNCGPSTAALGDPDSNDLHDDSDGYAAHNKSGCSPKTQDDDEGDAMQQIVKGAVARLRSTAPKPPPSLIPLKPSGVSGTLPMADPLAFTASDVELVWEHLFAHRYTDDSDERLANAQRSAVDDVYNNLPAELRALVMGARGEEETDSAAGSHGDRRADSMYLRNGRSITRVASRASVRKTFMHSLDFSKRGDEVGAQHNEDSFSFSNTIVLDADGNVVTASLDNDADVTGGAQGKHKQPDETVVVDAVRILEHELEVNAQKCQHALDNHFVITEQDEAAAQLAAQELAKKQTSLLARYRSSLMMFQERKRTTRLQSLLAGGSTTGDGSSGAALSRTMSALDFGDRTSSVDNAEIRPFLLPEDGAMDGLNHAENLGDSFGAYISPHPNSATPPLPANTTSMSGKQSQQHSTVTPRRTPSLDVTPPLPTDHPLEQRGPDHHDVPSRPGSSGTIGSLRQWSTATTDLVPDAKGGRQLPPRPLTAPSQPSLHHGDVDGAEVSSINVAIPKVTKGGRRRNDEIRKIRQHSAVLTSSEKLLLHSKRLSTEALQRECVALPPSVQKLLPTTAAKVVERMRDASLQRSQSRSTSTIQVSTIPPRPRSSSNSSWLFEPQGASSASWANAPATRVSTPQWSRIPVTPPTLCPIPTITCSPPHEANALLASTVSRDTIQDGMHTIVLTSSVAQSSASAQTGGFLQVPERPGTAPRKLTLSSLDASRMTPRSTTPLSIHASTCSSAMTSTGVSAVPSRSTSPTKELQQLIWPPSPMSQALSPSHIEHSVSLNNSLHLGGGGEENKNWNRWLQGGGDVTAPKTSITKFSTVRRSI